MEYLITLCCQNVWARRRPPDTPPAQHIGISEDKLGVLRFSSLQSKDKFGSQTRSRNAAAHRKAVKNHLETTATHPDLL